MSPLRPETFNKLFLYKVMGNFDPAMLLNISTHHRVPLFSNNGIKP
ncbi:MAG: hypothetical protein ACJAXS_002028, partial [Colwellia sp.]